MPNKESTREIRHPLFSHLDIQQVFDPKVAFGEEEAEKLTKEALEVARDGFGSKMTYEDVFNHLIKDPDFTYIVKINNRLAGFASFCERKFPEGRALYLDGIVVRKNHQKDGIFRIINSLQLEYGNYDFLTMRTQNPVIYGATRKLKNIEAIFPNIPIMECGAEIPADILNVANRTAEDLEMGGGINQRSFVGKGTYSHCLYEPMPYYEGVSEFFTGTLEMSTDEGDSVVIVARVNHPGVSN